MNSRAAVNLMELPELVEPWLPNSVLQPCTAGSRILQVFYLIYPIALQSQSSFASLMQPLSVQTNTMPPDSGQSSTRDSDIQSLGAEATDHLDDEQAPAQSLLPSPTILGLNNSSVDHRMELAEQIILSDGKCQ